MRREQILLLVGTAASYVSAADKPPRGVGPEFVSFYKPSSGTFQCISNPAGQLDYKQVNDDYCDCPDGSDEPGTSACAHLSSLSPQDPSAHFTSKPALPGFYCENHGHKPSYLPFTHVNDGICDYDACCDGSEEYGQVSKNKCPNKCKEIGDEWRKLDEIRQRSIDAAAKKRQELMAQAQVKRREMKVEIESLKTQIQGSESKIRKLKKELAAAEEQDKKNAKSPESKVQSLIDVAKPKMIEYSNALKKVQTQRDNYSSRVEQLEGILEDLHKSYNPNFNDEGVKRVVKSYEDYKASEGDGDDDVEDSPNESEIYVLTTMGEYAVSWDQYLDRAGDDADKSGINAIYDLQQYLPWSVREWISSKMGELRDMLIANGILSHSYSASSPGESKAVREARERLNTAQNDVESMKNKQKENEEDLTKDYGINDVFRSLKGNCVSLDAGEYTYEMCWLDRVRQKSKKGGMGEQDMGRFSGYEIVQVDEEMPADGRGLGSGKRISLKYEQGNHCWNGPDRSTAVILGCAETEEIWKVSEEEKCVYRMTVGTPAVCDEPGQERDSAANVQGGAAPALVEHDEL